MCNVHYEDRDFRRPPFLCVYVYVLIIVNSRDLANLANFRVACLTLLVDCWAINS